jgi:glycosyltransferase involved in cell wall biosynthesis
MPDRFGFITEHTVGHVTFERLLREAVADDGDIEAGWFPLGFEPRGALERLPAVRGNWSVRSSLRARALLARHRGPWDALLFHTQTPSQLSVGLMRRTPTVLSIDATPRNIDTVATGYRHAVGGRRVEAAKARVVGRAFRAAAALVAWSGWVRRSLVDDYGVNAEKIHVIPSGTVIPTRVPDREQDRLRLLFVGGDFERKGGDDLLAALGRLDPAPDLHVVTRSDVSSRDGITVHRDVAPGSARLEALYASCNAFVLPTMADASPHVIIEAMASGLPVISTPTGAIPEMVVDGETGLLVPPGEPEALAGAISALADAPLRARLGATARALAVERFDARRNARAVLETMKAATTLRPQ